MKMLWSRENDPGPMASVRAAIAFGGVVADVLVDWMMAPGAVWRLACLLAAGAAAAVCVFSRSRRARRWRALTVLLGGAAVAAVASHGLFLADRQIWYLALPAVACYVAATGAVAVATRILRPLARWHSTRASAASRLLA